MIRSSETIEMLVGGIIFTGQERPTGNKSRLREDLLKRFATGEGIAGRLPYGVLTKLYSIQGWKRMEMNKLLQFDHITEHNFESILRRIAIIKIKAMFFDKAAIEKLRETTGEHSLEEAGIFERDTSLLAFMSAGPACAAGHRSQLMFERKHDEAACRQAVQGYTRCGGDDGVGYKYMRKSCNLPDAPAGADPVAAIIEGATTEAEQDAKMTPADFMPAIHKHLAKECSARGWNFLTQNYCKAMWVTSQRV